MKKLRFITFHYVSLLVAMVFYFSKSPSAFSQNLNWVKQVSGSGSDYFKSMVKDANGNLYVCGSFSGTIDFGNGVSVGPAIGTDIWFGKYTTTGNLIWAHALIGGDDDAALDIAIDNSNDIYITGYYGTQVSLDFDPGPGNATLTQNGAFTAKYNSNGIFQWVRPITGAGKSVNYAIASDGSGNIFIAGRFALFPGGTYDFDAGPGTYNLNSSDGRMYIARYNSSGTVTWAKNFGGGSVDRYDLALDASNNLLITGWFDGANVDFNAGSGQNNLTSSNGSAFIVKYNSSGNFSWVRQINGQAGDEGKSIGVDASNNVYVTGKVNTNGGNIFLAKYNSSGTQQVIKSIGGSFTDIGQTLLVDGGNLYLMGYFNGTNVDFNPPANNRLLTSSGSFYNFFYGKYALSNLDCQWVRAVDFNIAGDYQINGARIVNNTLVLAGNTVGSGDFNSCGTSSTFSATTLDGFFVGYNASNSPLQITGPSVVCKPSDGTTTYTIVNAPQGTSVSWSTSPGNVLSPSTGTGNSFVTTPVNPSVSGFVTITATVAGVCGSSVTRTVWVGNPQITYQPPGQNPCSSNPYYYTSSIEGAFYEWTVDNPNVWIVSPNGYFSCAVISIDPEYFTISVTVSSGNCSYTVSLPGQLSPGLYCQCFYDPFQCPGQGGGMGFSVYPNPTSKELTLSLDDQSQVAEYEFEIYDQYGYLVKKVKGFRKIAFNRCERL
ncbi:MAG TPA: SBBP repeat-containing protein [Cyclobacteriaceae bacterium]|nr:SBBP repeat-containing protein [Cyclobacteriaceae bacterium]HRJ80719.1 SBBP repeat-containing protein [Cyclobacteriaceae bacterium]